MSKPVVLINGSGGAGKDTFVEFCAKYANVRNISSVDKIKDVARQLGWDGGKEEKDRKFLSDLKILSSEYNNYPYEYIKAQIEHFRLYDARSSIMFIHIREPEEIERVKKDFNCSTLLIKNKNKAIITSNMADANVENYKYDYVITNNFALEDLDMKAYRFMLQLRDSQKKHRL